MSHAHVSQQPFIHDHALAFLIRHRDEHLYPDRRRLIERCVTALIAAHDIGADSAEDVALQALGELEARGRRQYVDLTRTTPFAIFVIDPLSGRKRVFTLTDLMALVMTPALASQPVPSSRAFSPSNTANTTQARH